jgi:hypothetical protein
MDSDDDEDGLSSVKINKKGKTKSAGAASKKRKCHFSVWSSLLDCRCMNAYSLILSNFFFVLLGGAHVTVEYEQEHELERPEALTHTR